LDSACALQGRLRVRGEHVQRRHQQLLRRERAAYECVRAGLPPRWQGGRGQGAREREVDERRRHDLRPLVHWKKSSRRFSRYRAFVYGGKKRGFGRLRHRVATPTLRARSATRAPSVVRNRREKSCVMRGTVT